MRPTGALLDTLSNPTLQKMTIWPVGCDIGQQGGRGAIYDDTGSGEAGSVYVFSLGKR